MDKDKKNIDYWDKYYGSGKNKKDIYSDYDKRYTPKSAKETTNLKRSGRKNFEPEGKIIGSEYKARQTVKKRRKSPALRFTILIIIVFLAGFFTFYAIDNHLFSKNKGSAATGTDLKTQESQTDIAVDATEEADSPEDNSGSGDDSNEADSGEAAKKTDITINKNTGVLENTDQSLWQALIYFFKNLGKNKSELQSYPEKLELNIYFVIIGTEKVFGYEERSVSAGSPKIAASNAVKELLKGPYEDFNFAVIPAGTQLLGIEITNEIAKVDFSQEFLSESLDTSILDDYIIYTIVNTLTEIPEIQAVTFSIDGKDIREYGNVDLRLPAIRNEKYLEIKKD